MQLVRHVGRGSANAAARSLAITVLAAFAIAAATICSATQVLADDSPRLAVSYGTYSESGAFSKRSGDVVPLTHEGGTYQGVIDLSKAAGDSPRWSFYRTEGELNFAIDDFEFDKESGTLSFSDSYDPASLTFEYSVLGAAAPASTGKGLLRLQSILGAQSALGTQSVEASIPKTVYYKHGHGVHYGLPGGRSTQTYTVETPDGKELVAYCVNPPKGWVGEQDLHTVGLSGFKAGLHDIDMLAMVLYFGVGGPGYDAKMWPEMPSEYFGDSADTTRERHYCCVHILTSLATYGDEEMAFDKCSSSFKSWFQKSIAGDVVDEMKERWSKLSKGLRELYRDSCFMLDPTNLDGKHDNAQEMAVACAELPAGYVQLTKKTDNAALTSGNDCYSLEGAVYGLFETKAKAESHKKSNALAVATTAANGKAKFEDELAVGTYYVSEIEPSSGYKRDESVYAVEVESGKTAKVNGSAGVAETPVDCPLALMVAKWDAGLGKATPQGAASLAGAQFTVKFYAGVYNESNLPGSATRTWVFKTGSDGMVRFQDAAKHKVSGDDFYKNADGQVTLPLGTVSIVETKAPTGYRLKAADGGAPKLHVLQIVENAQAKTGASVKALNYSTPITESNTPVVSEVVFKGDYRLVKEASAEVKDDAPQEQKRVLVKGVQFQFVNDNENAVISPQSGKAVAKGGVVCTITTDENGFASTKAGKGVNGWDIPSGWSGALAYGTYIVHEVIPSAVQSDYQKAHGTKLSPAADWKVTVGSDGQYGPAPLVNNTIPQSALKVVKVDAETGNQIPLPVSFQLYDFKGNLVTYTSHYPEKTTQDTWTSNERGEVTLPMLLAGGKYTLKEVTAPEGYTLSDEEVTVNVDGYGSWDNPITVTFKDKPAKGLIEIQKTDSDSGDAVAGAQYIVVAAQDITTPEGTVRTPEGETVAVLVTDDEGKASTPGLYLGTYTVYEAKAPEGYALDVQEHSVAIEYEGQDVALVTAHAEFEDTPTELVIEKVDEVTGDALAGAVFKVVKLEGEVAADDGQSDGQDGNSEGADAGQVAGSGSDAAGEDAAAGSNATGSSDDGNGGAAGDDGSASSETPGAGTSAGEGSGGDQPSEGGDAGGSAGGKEGSEDGGDGNDAAGKSSGADANEWQIESDENGIARLGYLARGSYSVEEITAPDGYHFDLASAKRAFTVNDRGFIGSDGEGFSEKLVLSVSNLPNTIGTTATIDGGKSGIADGMVKIVDTISYSGCIPGKPYTAEGTLHRAETGDDGSRVDAGPVLDSAGKPVTAKVDFTPESQNGTVEVVFEFDATSLGDATLVAFEQVLQGEALFAAHEDINDEAQTVTLTKKEEEPKPEPAPKPKSEPEPSEPAIGTLATNGANGGKTLSCGAEAAIVDTVSYTGLTPGKNYEVEGTLHFVTVDRHGMKSDGGTVKGQAGVPIRVKQRFTADAAKGAVNVTFKIDGRELGGKKVVVFEKLFERKGGKRVPVCEHADIADEGQSVTFDESRPGTPTPTPGGWLPTTGDLLARYWWVAALVIATSLVICLIAVANHNRKRQ